MRLLLKSRSRLLGCRSCRLMVERGWGLKRDEGAKEISKLRSYLREHGSVESMKFSSVSNQDQMSYNVIYGNFLYLENQ